MHKIAAVFVLLLGACTAEVERVTVEEAQPGSILAPAELVSLQDISISPPNIPRTWEYKIEYLAKENAMVNEGDLLVRFDGQRLREQLMQRQSDLDAEIKEAERRKLENEAKLEQLILDRAEALKNKDIAKRKVEITDLSRSEIERKKQQAEYIIAEELYEQAVQRVIKHRDVMRINAQVQNAKVEKDRNRVRSINRNIEKLTITAPTSGMVTLVPNRDDDKPAIGDTVFMGSRILNLPALDKLSVKVEFDEADTAIVNLHKKVRVTLDAYPERPFEGEITEIGQSYRAKSSNNMKVVFDAWVTLEYMDLDIMRPGMKATVELVEGRS